MPVGEPWHRSLNLSGASGQNGKLRLNKELLTSEEYDSARATIEVDVSRAGLPNGAVLSDRLGDSRELRVADGKVQVTLPGRAAAIFVRK